jgi:hypothetical protein
MFIWFADIDSACSLGSSKVDDISGTICLIHQLQVRSL